MITHLWLYFNIAGSIMYLTVNGQGLSDSLNPCAQFPRFLTGNEYIPTHQGGFRPVSPLKSPF
jgi:hypothetical protein